MPIEIQILVTLFCGAFQVVGAAFIGQAARQLIDGNNPGIGSFFAGGMFAGAGTLMSFVFSLDGSSWMFPVGVALFFFVTLLVIFTPPETLQRFGATATSIAIGGFATLIGFGVLFGTIAKQEEIVFGILFGGCWGSVGLGFLLMGVRALFSGKPLRFRQKGAGKYEIVPDDDDSPSPPEPNKKTLSNKRNKRH